MTVFTLTVGYKVMTNVILCIDIIYSFVEIRNFGNILNMTIYILRIYSHVWLVHIYTYICVFFVCLCVWTYTYANFFRSFFNLSFCLSLK